MPRERFSTGRPMATMHLPVASSNPARLMGSTSSKRMTSLTALADTSHRNGSTVPPNYSSSTPPSIQETRRTLGKCVSLSTDCALERALRYNCLCVCDGNQGRSFKTLSLRLTRDPKQGRSQRLAGGTFKSDKSVASP